MAHFNHPRELTELSLKAISLLQRAGAATVNQSAILRGVNDDSAVLAELLGRLSANGVLPYYMFICRPTIGNASFQVPVEESWEILDRAKASLSGLARLVRLCTSHKTGKVEVIGKIAGHVILRYHRAARVADHGRFMIFKSDPKACWLDDYTGPAEEALSLDAFGLSAPSLPT